MRRLSRSLSRKQKGSANRCKARGTLAKLHARIAAIRVDVLHKLTTDLTRRLHTIVIEDLNVRGTAKNRCLALHPGHGMVRVQAPTWVQGGDARREVVVADRFFASSKMCSACSDQLEALPLSGCVTIAT